MKALQERYKDDKPKLQQEMLKLYQEEKVNPVAGCLPILLQIPIFYALYKVLMLSVEMRHQPFVLWIKDLSAPDPLTPVNLFGLLAFTPPSLPRDRRAADPARHHDVAAVQAQPAPMPDPVQQQMFAIMPWVLMFVMAPFAAGLQLYWVTTNIVSTIPQQKWLYQHASGAEAAAPARRAAPPPRPPPPPPQRRRRRAVTAMTSWTRRRGKLFAGPVAFLKSAPELKFLPDRDGAGGRLRRPLQRRQIVAAQRADQPQRRSPAPRTRRGGRRSSTSSTSASRCSSGWSTCPATASPRRRRTWSQALALPGQRLSARPAGAEARAGADRHPPRHQGRRPRDDEDARRRGGQLPAGPDQGRQDQGDASLTAVTASDRRRRRASAPPRIRRSSPRRARAGWAWTRCARRCWRRRSLRAATGARLSTRQSHSKTRMLLYQGKPTLDDRPAIDADRMFD